MYSKAKSLFSKISIERKKKFLNILKEFKFGGYKHSFLLPTHISMVI